MGTGRDMGQSTYVLPRPGWSGLSSPRRDCSFTSRTELKPGMACRRLEHTQWARGAGAGRAAAAVASRTCSTLGQAKLGIGVGAEEVEKALAEPGRTQGPD